MLALQSATVFLSILCRCIRTLVFGVFQRQRSTLLLLLGVLQALEPHQLLCNHRHPQPSIHPYFHTCIYILTYPQFIDPSVHPFAVFLPSIHHPSVQSYIHSFQVSVYLSMHLPIYPSINLLIHLPVIHPSVHPATHLIIHSSILSFIYSSTQSPIHPHNFLSTHPSTYPSTYPLSYPSIHPSTCSIIDTCTCPPIHSRGHGTDCPQFWDRIEKALLRTSLCVVGIPLLLSVPPLSLPFLSSHLPAFLLSPLPLSFP